LSPASHYDAYWRESWSNRRLWWALLVSACLHTAAICLVPAARYKPRIIEFPPLYEVQLVKVESPRPAPPKPKPPVKKRVEQPKKEVPKVVPPKVEPKKEKKPEEKKPERVEKPVEPKPEEPKPEKPPAPPAPKVETKATIEADVPLWYRLAVVDTVRRHWEEPLVGGGVALETIVYFEIVRSGEVTSARIEKESGDRRWDLAGLRAVMESRFAPLPQDYKGATLTVHFAFTHEWETAQ
jgi:TonB family protein